jgi:hypothetical protein
MKRTVISITLALALCLAAGGCQAKVKTEHQGGEGQPFDAYRGTIKKADSLQQESVKRIGSYDSIDGQGK